MPQGRYVQLTLCQPLQRHPPRPLSEEDIYDVVAPFRGPMAFLSSRRPADSHGHCVPGLCPAGHPAQGALGPDLSSLAQVTTSEQCESLGPGLAFLCKNYIHQLLLLLSKH